MAAKEDTRGFIIPFGPRGIHRPASAVLPMRRDQSVSLIGYAGSWAFLVRERSMKMAAVGEEMPTWAVLIKPDGTLGDSRHFDHEPWHQDDPNVHLQDEDDGYWGVYIRERSVERR